MKYIVYGKIMKKKYRYHNPFRLRERWLIEEGMIEQCIDMVEKEYKFPEIFILIPIVPVDNEIYLMELERNTNQAYKIGDNLLVNNKKCKVEKVEHDLNKECVYVYTDYITKTEENEEEYEKVRLEIKNKALETLEKYKEDKVVASKIKKWYQFWK
ncbi:hypothetical protein ACU3L3_07565 [Priestia endophytica]